MRYFKHEQALVGAKANIGDNTRVWAFTNIQDGAVIGAHCNICDGCFVEKGAVVGSRVTVKNNVAIFDGITIEDEVFVGANITFINDRHPRSPNDGQWSLEKTIVRKGATLGAGSTIMGGLEIGEYAFIGAGSVVTKNVAPYTMCYGNPAREKGYVCRCGKMLDAKLTCGCGKKYHPSKKGLAPDE
ncbi:MAG: acyltransferase [Candidatus Omnitrophota bacterium]